MNALPAHLEALELELASAARRRVALLRRRRRVTQAVAVAAITLALASVAVAASGIGVGWLTGGGSDEARFRIDPSARYDGAAPQVVGCSAATTGALFGCGASAGGEPRVYDLLYRVSAPEITSGEDLLAKVAVARSSGAIDAATEARFSRAAEAVGDGFLDKLALLFQLNDVSAARGERIPPDGVPELATCAATADGTLDCRALRGAGAVPVGAPIYHLRATADWQPRPATSADPSLDSGTGSQTEDVVREIFGRPLSQDELALLLLIVSPAKAEPAEVTTTTAAPQGSAGSAQQAR